ncbi:MAG: XdhC family protein [Geothrix sp.]|uniref:XdhC family protein n=1 Tax=Geothrix sp. TaxID=1962974 RepID=UPI001814B593|nr:XdhC/CoxI family protein [Geothrix sp.]NWJ39740.1 XdhC family protein [Geothrix sp.]WIL22245.1 MAG: XdhC family protein [Geothrix sp.]
MKELQDILRLVRERPGPLALATLVRAEGASYRRTGARLLLDASGPLRGSLSGGCLEGDVQARALEALAQGRPKLVQYDLRGELDLVWGSGSGCEGVLDILIEPLPGFPQWMTWIEQAWASRTGIVLHTDLDPDGLGQRCLLAQAGDPGPGFTEIIHPPLALWILGASDDSRPLVHLAKALGWFVGVVDHRPAFAQPARFPEADAVRSGHPAQVLPTLPLDARSAVVLMTHHYAKDLEALRLLLPSKAGYLGLMGSRARGAKLLGELAAEGLHPDARLHTPVGLDLGATDPEGIALAILAEVQAFATERSGSSLGGTRTRVMP